MIYNGTIEKKIRLLENTLEEIENWKIVDYSKFKNSSLEKAAVERKPTVVKFDEVKKEEEEE